MASKEYYQLLEQLRNRPSSANLSLEEMRRNFDKFLGSFPPDPDVSFDSFSIQAIPACWVVAKGATKDKVVLFFFGGGFNAGSINSHKCLMGKISRAAGCAVLAIDYRLAPEFPFPAALEDALQSYQWLLKQGYNSSSLFVAGSSAGGGLVLSLGLKLKEKKLPQPAALVCLCPWADLTFSSDSIKTNQEKDWLRIDRLSVAAKDYCKHSDPKNPLISPLFGDLHGLPPLLIQVGSYEIFRDEVALVAKKAKQSGVRVTFEEWPEMVHCWQLFASKIPEGQKAIDHIGTFLSSF